MKAETFIFDRSFSEEEMGFSRDDAGKFLDAYYDTKIFESDPFAKLAQIGVGKLMKMAMELGRSVNPNLHVGICGEHGGDTSSVEFCHKIGLDYNRILLRGRQFTVFLFVIGGICSFINESASLGWQGLIVGIIVAVVPQALTLWGAEGIGCLKELLARI